MAKTTFSDYIIFENAHYVIINKPAHIASLADRSGDISVLELARSSYPDIQLCHRIDKETSGILALAKDPEAYRHLSMQFEHRQVKKKYHAVVNGIHSFSSKEINDPLIVTSSGIVKIDKRKGKEAITIVDSLEFYKNHTLVSCEILTGRTHQIRIHLSSIGASIVGDPLYGGKNVYLSELKKFYKISRFEDEKPLINRFALHAVYIKFAGVKEESLAFEAPYPKDFSVLLKQLKKYS